MFGVDKIQMDSEVMWRSIIYAEYPVLACSFVNQSFTCLASLQIGSGCSLKLCS